MGVAWWTVRRGTSYPGNSRPDKLESSEPELVSAETRLPELREMGRLSPEESDDLLNCEGIGGMDRSPSRWGGVDRFPFLGTSYPSIT